METKKVKCLIIGFGPTGYTIVIYTARANLSSVFYGELQLGGQLATITDIENLPGYPEGINSTQMMDDLCRQAERLGTDSCYGVATAADLSRSPCKITIDKERVTEARIVTTVTGIATKYLGLKDEERHVGMGVGARITCDGSFYRKKVVVVVGGGGMACEEASYPASLVSKTYSIMRKPFLYAPEIVQRWVTRDEEIEMPSEHDAVGLHGDSGAEGVHSMKRMGEPDEQRYDLTVDGFLLAIGHKPNSDIFKPYAGTDEAGYILTKPDTPRTEIPRVFAAEGVADPHYRQAITAAATRCMTAIEVEGFLPN